MSADKPNNLQDMILSLHGFWAKQGCAILQPYDMEVGAGTFHPATALRVLGSDPWSAAYTQTCRRPADGRYGENPNRLQRYLQYQVIRKPFPVDLREQYLKSLETLGIDIQNHEVRFVEDNWESQTLGAFGLGWEIWLDGMEISQFTYFQQFAGQDCEPVSGEITYGLERLAMFVFGIDNVYDLPWSPDLTYGDLYLQEERQYSRWNFDIANDAILDRGFRDAKEQCTEILETIPVDPRSGEHIIMVLPAYDQCIKASHFLNLLDARGTLDVTERQRRIQQVRDMATACATAYLEQKERSRNTG